MKWEVEATVINITDPDGNFSEVRLGDPVRGFMSYDLKTEPFPLIGNWYFHDPAFEVASMTLENPRIGTELAFVADPNGLGSAVVVFNDDETLSEEAIDSVTILQSVLPPQGFTGTEPSVFVSLIGPPDVLPNALLPATLNLDDWPNATISFSGVSVSGADMSIDAEIHTPTPVAVPPPAGDYDRDGDVTPLDYDVWRANYGSTTNLDGDGNSDGIVDAADYAVWRHHAPPPRRSDSAFALGGPEFPADSQVVAGADGSVYVSGSFSGGVDFDPGPGFELLSAREDANDNFVAKYSPQGEVVWAQSLGGVRNDFNEALGLDAEGYIYLAGHSISNPVEFGDHSLPTRGNFDVYVSKVNATTGDFVWARSFGGMESDTGNDIIINGTGDVYVTGSFRSTVDFDPSESGTFNLTAATGANIADVFVTKLDTRGDFVWARQFTGPADEFGHRVALSKDGHLYAVGTFRDTTDFGEPGDPLPISSTTPGIAAIFFVKLEESAGHTVWAKPIGGTAPVTAARVASDGDGNVYVAGRFENSMSFGAGSPTFVSGGGQDGFISKWDAEGNFIWAAHVASGPGNVLPGTLRLDSAGNPLLAFGFDGTADFDPGMQVAALTSVDVMNDGAVLKLNADGSFGWVLHMSGPGVTEAQGLVEDSDGNLYVSGSFQDSVLLPNGETLTEFGGGTFVMRLPLDQLPGSMGAAQLASVPEPASMMLNVICLSLTSAYRVRQRPFVDG